MPQLSDAEIAAVAKSVGWTGTNLVTAVAVALAESGGNSDRVNDKLNANGSVDYGLFQINSVHADLLRKYDWRSPQQNATMAMQVWKQQGWRGWSSYKNKSYGRFQGRAMIAVAAPADLTKPTIAQARWWIPNYPDKFPGPNELKDPTDLLPDNIPGPVDAYNGITDALNKILEFFGKLGEGLGWLGDVSHWKQVGLFAFGLTLTIVGIARMTNAEKGLGAAAKVAINVVPIGRAAGVAGKALKAAKVAA
jgi:hypothetical protein